MAKLLDVPSFCDERGNLCVIEKLLPFEIRRVFYIYGATKRRAGHRHVSTQMFLLCVSGGCMVYSCDGRVEQRFELNSPQRGLLLKPQDWHYMDAFSENCVLLVLASSFYDPNDYIDEPYSLSGASDLLSPQLS